MANMNNEIPNRKSPEEIKEERALELAKEIMEISAKPEEEQTIEDNQKIIQLLK